MNLTKHKEEFKNGQIDKWTYIDKMYDVHSVLFQYADFIKSTEISKIEIENGDIIMTFRRSEVKFVCAENDKRLAPLDALNFESYEEDELKMQMELMEEDSNILDIGGNYGWYALHVAKRYPKAKIFTFEPIPDTYKYLIKNIKLNNLSNIVAYNFGLSDIEGQFFFYYDSNLSVNASLKNVSENDSVSKITCDVKTLDTFSEQKDMPIDFIKCDVEGAELLAFKGGLQTVSKNLPVIFTEMLRKWTSKFGYHPNDIINFLCGLGYKCYVLAEKKLNNFTLVDETTVETNYFFLHSVKHSHLIKKFT